MTSLSGTGGAQTSFVPLQSGTYFCDLNDEFVKSFNNISEVYYGQLTFTVNPSGNVTGGQLDFSGQEEIPALGGIFDNDCTVPVGPNSSFTQNGTYTMNLPAGCNPLPVATTGKYLQATGSSDTTWVYLQPNPGASYPPPTVGCILENQNF